MIYISKQTISKQEFDRLNQLLTEINFDDDSVEMENLIDKLDAKQDSEEYSFYFEFENGAKIFLDICSGESNYYGVVTWVKGDKIMYFDYFGDKAYKYLINGSTYIVKFIIEED